uniref:Uncharacterized protein n=1 Tax=Taeniopygia guttata TaxID=59729 RepID=H0ZHJ7_TAEGU
MRSPPAAEALSQCNKCPPGRGGRRRRGGGRGAAAQRSGRPGCHSPRRAPGAAARPPPPRARAPSLGPPGTPYGGPLPSSAQGGIRAAQPARSPCRAGRRWRGFPRPGAVVAAGGHQQRRRRAPRRRNDHPGQVLHVRQDSGEQVGSLPWPPAGGVHGRRCPGCPWLEEILLPQNAPRPCGSD